MLVPEYASPRRGALHADATVRRVRRLHRRLGDRRRAVHARAGHEVRLVARPHARRPHEPLGAHLAPLRSRRLPRQEPRRARRRLADRLRRRRAVLRQGRPADRRLRQQRRTPQPSRRQLPPAAQAALLRAAGQEGVRQAQASPASRRGSRSSRSRINGRPACHYCGQCNRGCTVNVQLLQPRRADRAGAQDGPAHAASPTRWRARSRSARTGSRRRRLHRQERPATNGTSARSVVVLAASACESARLLLNSKSHAVPAGARQLERRGRQVPHRHHRHRRRGLHPEDGGPRRRTTRTASAACTSTCPGGSTTRSSTSRAATTSRSAAGCGMPGVRLHGRHPALSRRAAATARQLKDDYRRYYGATIGFSGRGEMIPNDDCYCEIDPERGGPVRHSRAALPLEVERPRAATR